MFTLDNWKKFLHEFYYNANDLRFTKPYICNIMNFLRAVFKIAKSYENSNIDIVFLPYEFLKTYLLRILPQCFWFMIFSKQLSLWNPMKMNLLDFRFRTSIYLMLSGFVLPYLSVRFFCWCYYLTSWYITFKSKKPLCQEFSKRLFWVKVAVFPWNYLLINCRVTEKKTRIVSM